MDKSPMRAAGSPAMRTLASPGGRIGPPTWGVGSANGQVCMSDTRAAGAPMVNQAIRTAALG